MKKKTSKAISETLSTLTWIGIVLLIFILNYNTFRIMGEPIEIDLKNLVYKEYQQGEVNDFIILAQRFARNHEPNDSYNCQNYTRDFHDIAEELGFKTEKIKGCPLEKNETCHAWLRLAIDFEPQEGKFKDYSLEYPRQEAYD